MRGSPKPAKTRTKPPKSCNHVSLQLLHPAASLEDRTVEILEKSQFLWCREVGKPTMCPGREEMEVPDPRDQAHIPLPGRGLHSDPSTGTRKGFSSHQIDTKKSENSSKSYNHFLIQLLLCCVYTWLIHNSAAKPSVLCSVGPKSQKPRTAGAGRDL